MMVYGITRIKWMSIPTYNFAITFIGNISQRYIWKELICPDINISNQIKNIKFIKSSTFKELTVHTKCEVCHFLLGALRKQSKLLDATYSSI